MDVLQVENLNKRYDERPLLEQISFRLSEDSRVGLLGANGCGKSTLLKILAGIEEPDAGEVSFLADIRVGYLDQEPQLPDQPIRDVVVQGLEGRSEILAQLEEIHEQLATVTDPGAMEKLLRRQTRLEQQLEERGGYDVEHRVESLIDHLGLPHPEAQCSHLSGGERRRVALARLLLSKPDLMLLDEPTNHLDAIVTEWLEDELLATKTPLLMVTHDRYFLDRVVDRILEFDGGKLYEYEGNYGAYLVARAERLEQEAKAEASRQILLRRETAWMRRGPPARTTKSKARIQRFHALVDAAPDARDAPLQYSIPPGPRLGTKGIELVGVSKGFAGRALIEGLDLELNGGKRLGIVGPNGAGKTTLLKLCLGELDPDAGEVKVGETVKVAAIDQQRTELDPDRTVVEEVARDNDYVFVEGQARRVESFLEQFLFPGNRKYVKVGSLSGGERNRVLLAKLLLSGGNVIALDEPTNDLDLMTLRALEEGLLTFPGAVVVVSHDRYFLDRVATHILAFDGKGNVRFHEGSLSDLLTRMEKEATPPAAPAKKKKPAKDPKPAPTRKRLSFQEKKEYEELPDQIDTAEQELADWDQRISDPALYEKGPDEIQKAVRRHGEAKERVQRLYERWEELEGRS